MAEHRTLDPGPREELERLRRAIAAGCRAFGLLRVRAGRERTLLIGDRASSDGPLPVLSWRDSPLARVFLTHHAGEEYELALEDRVLEGAVLDRWLLGVDRGRLCWVDTGDSLLVLGPDGCWRAEPPPRLSDDLPPPPGARGSLLVPEEDLDAEQRAVLAAPADQTLLVSGAAGSGKTTVCLRRVARIGAPLGRDEQPTELAVVVPGDGLARLAGHALERLGSQASVTPWRAWIVARGQRGLPRLPRVICPETPTRVRRFFRHPALLASLPAWVEEHCEALVEEVDRTLFAWGAILRLWHAHDQIPAQRLRLVERAWRATKPKADQRRIAAAFGRARRDLADPRPAWQALWQDRRLLERAVEASGGALGPADVQAVLDHAWLQFSETAEQAFAHVDPERLRTVDGLGLDEGTPDEVAGTIDLEAYAVLLVLRTLLLGPPRPGGRLAVHSHLMVDEIQERAPVELRTLADAVRPGGGLTMSGDAAQLVDAAHETRRLADTARIAGVSPQQAIQLRQAHRSTTPITHFCHQLLGPMASGGPPAETRDGPPVRCETLAAHGAVLARMGDTLTARSRGALELAIIAHDPERATHIADTLRELVPVQLVLDGLFDLHRGLWVTTVDLVGGLEFDSVWVPDADADTYPLRDGARRRLYVACSRARRLLWVLSPGPPSRILPGG